MVKEHSASWLVRRACVPSKGVSVEQERNRKEAQSTKDKSSRSNREVNDVAYSEVLMPDHEE